MTKMAGRFSARTRFQEFLGQRAHAVHGIQYEDHAVHALEQAFHVTGKVAVTRDIQHEMAVLVPEAGSHRGLDGAAATYFFRFVVEAAGTVFNGTHAGQSAAIEEEHLGQRRFAAAAGAYKCVSTLGIHGVGHAKTPLVSDMAGPGPPDLRGQRATFHTVVIKTIARHGQKGKCPSCFAQLDICARKAKIDGCLCKEGDGGHPRSPKIRARRTPFLSPPQDRAGARRKITKNIVKNFSEAIKKPGYPRLFSQVAVRPSLVQVAQKLAQPVRHGHRPSLVVHQGVLGAARGQQARLVLVPISYTKRMDARPHWLMAVCTCTRSS